MAPGIRFNRAIPYEKLSLVPALLVFLGMILPLHAQVPQLINYQGRVAVNGTNFDGTGQFKFALVNTDGFTTCWSNDGTGTGGNAPRRQPFPSPSPRASTPCSSAMPGLPKTTISQLAGKRYTIILPAPDATLGHGYATLIVTTKGTGTLAGKLADGTTFTTTSQIEDDPTDVSNWLVPVHIPVYSGSGGMVAGEVLLSKTEPAGAADVTGSLGWLRPPITNAKMFPSGFLKSLDPLGERYQLIKGSSLLTGTAATGNFTLTAGPSGTVLPVALNQAGTWPMTNLPLLNKPVTSSLKLTFTGTTGVFKGTFSRTVIGKSVSTPYEGVILASPLTLPEGTAPVRGGGFFSTGNASGPVELTSP